jgi:hypothetical protein
MIFFRSSFVSVSSKAFCLKKYNYKNNTEHQVKIQHQHVFTYQSFY